MFKLNEIRELIRLLDETSVTELQVEASGTKLVIKKDFGVTGVPVIQQPIHAVSAPVLATASAVATPVSATALATSEQPATNATVSQLDDPTLHKIVSPMVGTFYSSPAPDVDSYVQVGSKVNEKSVVCIVEAMKLMNEIEADIRGEIVAVLVDNGQFVEYGQPMFLVKKD